MEDKPNEIDLELTQAAPEPQAEVVRHTARRKFHWQVPLQTEKGQTLARDVHAYWDPNKDETRADIATAARIEATRELKAGCVVVGEPVLIS